MDNLVSSYNLGQMLLFQGLKMVATIRSHKSGIPPKLLQCKKVALFQSTFSLIENTTPLSNLSRKGKCVVLCSFYSIRKKKFQQLFSIKAKQKVTVHII